MAINSEMNRDGQAPRWGALERRNISSLLKIPKRFEGGEVK
jgi:hypothetical protein